MPSGLDYFLGGFGQSARDIGAGLGERARTRRENAQLREMLETATRADQQLGTFPTVQPTPPLIGQTAPQLPPMVGTAVPLQQQGVTAPQAQLGGFNPLQETQQRAAQAEQNYQREQAAFMMNLIPLATHSQRGGQLAKFALDSRGEKFVNEAANTLKRADATLKSVAATAAIGGDEAAIRELQFAAQVASPQEKAILGMVDPNNLQGSIAQLTSRLDQSGEVAKQAIESRFKARDERIKSQLKREEEDLLQENRVALEKVKREDQEALKRLDNKLKGDKSTFENATKLRKEYTGLSSEFRKVRDSYQRITATDDTPQGDIALIFNFMKMLDPGSVVRESEFATAENAAGVPERVRVQFNKALRGEKLSAEQRENFVSQAGSLFEQQQNQQAQREETFTNLANRYNIPVDEVVISFDSASQQHEGSTTETQTVDTQAQYDALPSGAVFIDSADGKRYRKP